MDFKCFFEEQLKNHPSIQYQDAVKLCDQAAFGAEHILSDSERARAYFYTEFDAIFPSTEPLFEKISPLVARVNLGAWKKEDKDPSALFEAFKNSAVITDNARETLLSYLDIAEQSMVDKIPNFDKLGWQKFLDEYKAADMPPIHHSAIYRENEQPSYRIVKISELEKIL